MSAEKLAGASWHAVSQSVGTDRRCGDWVLEQTLTSGLLQSCRNHLANRNQQNLKPNLRMARSQIKPATSLFERARNLAPKSLLPSLKIGGARRNQRPSGPNPSPPLRSQRSILQRSRARPMFIFAVARSYFL